jgi:hypothetical protein
MDQEIEIKHLEVSDLLVLSCLGSGLPIGRSPLQVGLPTLYKIQISQLVNYERQRVRERNQ